MVRNLDDIERDKQEEERRIMNEDIANNIKDIFGRLSPKPKKNWLWLLIKILIKIILVLGLLLLAINFLLANIWLLKFFIKELF